MNPGDPHRLMVANERREQSPDLFADGTVNWDCVGFRRGVNGAGVMVVTMQPAFGHIAVGLAAKQVSPGAKRKE